MWLSQFTPVCHNHLLFVQALLRTLCFVGLFSILTGVYAAYIAGMLASYWIEEWFHICHLYIAKRKFSILGPLLHNVLSSQ